MLYGTEEQQNRILKEVHLFEESHKVRVIFGSMVGSISKGFNRVGSDYDTRFLFIRDDFPVNTINAHGIDESIVIKREYYSNEWFEWIPYWELTSFLNYLSDPYISKFSYGLYNVVGWTFTSPYQWDPYGISNKIFPIIQKCVYPEYIIGYHWDQYNSYDISDSRIPVRFYLYKIHAALTIEWVLKYKEFPPVYMESLLIIRPELTNDCRRLNGIMKDTSLKINNDDNIEFEKKRKSGYYTLVEHCENIDKYFCFFDEMMKGYTLKIMNEAYKELVRSYVEKIKEIIFESL